MAQYRMLTTWLLDSSRQRVWDTLADVERWPDWWEGVAAVRVLDPGDERRIGARYGVSWRAPAGYTLRIDFAVGSVDEPHSMTGRSSGALEGRGTWRLFEQAGVTAVIYDWDVRTAKPWMNVLAPIARPLFVRSHDALMLAGGEGLANMLGAKLMAT